MENVTGVPFSTTVSAQATDDPIAAILATIMLNACVYYLGILVLPEMACSALTIAVLAQTPAGTTRTTRVYYLVIATCELSVLCSKGLFMFFFGFGVPYVVPSVNWWSVHDDLVECFFMYFFWFTPEAVANNTFVALGVERMIALTWPMKAKSLISVRRALFGIAFLAVTFTIIVWICMTEAVQFNPYLPQKVGCYNGATSFWLNSVGSIPKYLTVYVVPACMSITLSVLLVFKIRKISRSNALLLRKEDSKVNASEVESCVTLIIVSTVHVLFYVPVATFRVVAIVLPRVATISSNVSQELFLLGMTFYVGIIPVHLMNFIIYCRRLKNFKENVLRLLQCKSVLPA